MILLTRLGGQPLAVNPDLIERAEATPDTVITMSDGHKLVVSESLPQLVALVRRWRAEVAAESFELSGLQASFTRRPALAVDPDELADDDTTSEDGAQAAAVRAFAAHPSLGAKVVRLPFVED